MTLKEKIILAEAEVLQAERMVVMERKSVKEWEDRLDLRRETLRLLKLSQPGKVTK